MKIGEPLKEYVVEPLENPVPVEKPLEAPKSEPVPLDPDKEPTYVRS